MRIIQVPPNSIVSPLTQLILQIPGKQKKKNKTEKQKIPVLKSPRCENPEQTKHNYSSVLVGLFVF